MKPPVAALVALGSALGAGLRWTLSLLLAGGGHGPPWPILLVNALGALAAGIYAGRHGPQGRRPHDLRLQAFVLPGLCAGFTTFSIFSLDALHWGVARGAWSAAVLVLASVATWLLAVAAGDRLGRRF